MVLFDSQITGSSQWMASLKNKTYTVGVPKNWSMEAKEVENGLWGFKGELKSLIEGNTYPTWLTEPPSTTHSGASYLSAQIEYALTNDVDSHEVSFEIDYENAPDKIQSRLDDFAEEEGQPEAWELRAHVDGKGRVNQSEMEIYGRF